MVSSVNFLFYIYAIQLQYLNIFKTYRCGAKITAQENATLVNVGILECLIVIGEGWYPLSIILTKLFNAFLMNVMVGFAMQTGCKNGDHKNVDK